MQFRPRLASFPQVIPRAAMVRSASASTTAKPERSRGSTRRADKEPSAPLQSRGAIVFAGLSYLFTAFAFCYVERSYRAFGFACLLWLVWAALGFGAGVFNQRGPEGAGRRQWQVLGLLGFVLAVFPGILLFSFPRWVCMVLLVVMGARAAHRLNVKQLKRVFAFVLYALAAYMLYRGLTA